MLKGISALLGNASLANQVAWPECRNPTYYNTAVYALFKVVSWIIDYRLLREAEQAPIFFPLVLRLNSNVTFFALLLDQERPAAINPQRRGKAA